MGLSISAHSAGVSVSATSADSSVETATVIANCLYMTPAMPPRKPTGTKTAARISAIATTGPLTSSIALMVASRGLSRLACMWCSTASTTTIASSTTMPMASTMPNSVSVLMVKPSSVKAAKVATSDTGTASIGITVARQFCRNRNTTISTSNSASKKVCTTSSSDALTNTVLSITTSCLRSAGNDTASASSSLRSRVAVSIALASGVRLIEKAAAGLPL